MYHIYKANSIFCVIVFLRSLSPYSVSYTHLPERDKYIITQRNLGIPRSAIGKKLGISGSRVGQIEAKARHRLIRLQIHE